MSAVRRTVSVDISMKWKPTSSAGVAAHVPAVERQRGGAPGLCTPTKGLRDQEPGTVMVMVMAGREPARPAMLGQAQPRCQAQPGRGVLPVLASKESQLGYREMCRAQKGTLFCILPGRKISSSVKCSGRSWLLACSPCLPHIILPSEYPLSFLLVLSAQDRDLFPCPPCYCCIPASFPCLHLCPPAVITHVHQVSEEQEVMLWEDVQGS